MARFKQAFTVEAITEVTRAVVQDDSQARRLPVRFCGCERDDVHKKVFGFWLLAFGFWLLAFGVFSTS